MHKPNWISSQDFVRYQYQAQLPVRDDDSRDYWRLVETLRVAKMDSQLL